MKCYIKKWNQHSEYILGPAQGEEKTLCKMVEKNQFLDILFNKILF